MKCAALHNRHTALAMILMFSIVDIVIDRWGFIHSAVRGGVASDHSTVSCPPHAGETLTTGYNIVYF